MTETEMLVERNSLFVKADNARKAYNQFLNDHWNEFKGDERLDFSTYYVDSKGMRVQ